MVFNHLKLLLYLQDGINAQEKMLSQTKTDYDIILSEVERSIEPFARLYDGVVDYLKEKKVWYNLPLVQGDAEESERNADGMKRR